MVKPQSLGTSYAMFDTEIPGFVAKPTDWRSTWRCTDTQRGDQSQSQVVKEILHTQIFERLYGTLCNSLAALSNSACLTDNPPFRLTDNPPVPNLVLLVQFSRNEFAETAVLTLTKQSECFRASWQ